MKRIFSFKNLTKKTVIFFLVFSFLILSNTKISNAEISPFGYGTATTTCADDINKCGITPSLKSYALNNPNYKLENTDINLDGNFGRTSFKINDFNISLDNFIKERLYRGEEYGYFGNSTARKFNSFETAFLNFTQALSSEQRKPISLLLETLNGNLGTQETRLADAKFITKILAGNDHGHYDNKSLQITTLLYYYLKIYLTIDKYITINKSLIPVDVLTKLVTLNEGLRSDIYSNLYKDDRISRSDGCTSDGTALDKCTIFSTGIFTVTGLASTQDMKFDAIYKVNQLKLDASKDAINANNIQLDPNITNADPNTRKAYGDKDECDIAVDISWWFSLNPKKNTDGCSFTAVLINSVIQGLSGLVGIVVNLAGALFDWIYDKGVIHFKEWVDGSGAYVIYKTIILALIVSVMTFFVFYLIIRRLIDDDGDKMNKILPKLILTALFVYFSFTITGWIIDQSNIITIYLYRSITHHVEPAQPISGSFKNMLSLDSEYLNKKNSSGNGQTINYGISLGSWNAVPFTLGQLAVNIVGVFVLFQGAILILSRTIILLLCMIFSPIMLLPEGLSELTDKYKKVVTDNFSGNILLGPVFMFLVLLAFQIGEATKSWIGGNVPTSNTGISEIPPSFLGGIISSVLVIVVLQLAISASKSLSGSMGEKLGGVIGKYAGGAAFGGGARVLRNTLGRGAAVAREKGWMMGKAGSGRHKFMTNLYNGVSKSTFDARNTKAAEFSGASIGQGSTKNHDDSFKAKLYKENKYHDSLDAGGKQRNLARLKNSADLDGQRIADNLGKNWKPSINERLNNDSDYNKKFDKAHNEKDEGKRKTETEKVINEHFKENGKGAEHFSKEIVKPENNKIKQDYDKAINEKDPEKRKESLTKVIADIDKKTEKESSTSLTQSLEQSRMVPQSADARQSEKRHEGLESMRSRAQEKYGKPNVSEEESKKRMTLYNEKKNEEIKAEKEKNGGYVPTAQDLNAQTSLKNRLKEKWTPEKQDAFFEGVEKRADDKAVAKSIERNEKKQMDANVNYINNLSSGSNNNKGPELSNSSVSNNPPVITVDTGARNKIEIPLTKEDGKPNIIKGDTTIFSQN